MYRLLALLGLVSMVSPAIAFVPTTRTHNVPISFDSIVASSTTCLYQSSAPADNDLLTRLQSEVKELYNCAQLAFGPLFQPDSSVSTEATDIVKLCDEIDELRNKEKSASSDELLVESIQLKAKALSFRRYELLAKMMRADYTAYVATASFLGSRVPRNELPNVQDVPYPDMITPAVQPSSAEDPDLVPDCTMEPMKYNDSPLDKILLKIFRNLVTKNTGGVSSDKAGIEGLLEQGRTFMLQPDQTSEAQHKMVRDTLGGLMTPVLPPFYRIFMSGIVPKADWVPEDLRGKQIGPWFYAPFLTSFVTPTFFAFLVGPSYPNRRKDGQPGGLVVEKCKFLQESGCKGLCLHQCKLPAQQFFKDELGLSLTVSPNFVTQECQWSFGEEPLPPQDDPTFPKGCLVGCDSRRLVAEMGGKADICSV
jgi:hypothetical protein